MSIPFTFAGVGQGSLKRRHQIVDLYDALRPSLFAYLSCLGLTTDEAEDVIQDSFCRLVRHVLKRGADKNLRGWVFRVAHNAAMDLSHSARESNARSVSVGDISFEEPPDLALNPEEIAIWKEELRDLRASMARLTTQQRSAVLLRAEGLRYREIAGVLGVSIQRVADLVQRALARLVGDQ